MLNRRQLLGTIVLSAALSLGPIAAAAERQPFDQAAFEAAQAAGKPILVEVSAPWCPTCKAQAPILARLRSEAKFKDLLRKFNVQTQSTLIVFKGKQETGRSTGVTDAAAIEALLAKSI